LRSYGGIGLGQGITNWKPVGRSRASKRGNREIKRVLFLAAEAATKSHSRLAERYAAHLRAGWKRDAAIRDLARTILDTASCLWRKGLPYEDRRVTVPADMKR
jgi:transposase